MSSVIQTSQEAAGISVEPSGSACGAFVRGVDFSEAVPSRTVAEIRRAWLEHHVLAFPDQQLSDEDLERFALLFGPIGTDPYIEPMPGKQRIAAISRHANETAPLFAEAWHTDWSFLKVPPAGTCLYGVVIPPTGGNTLFANQHRALEAMPSDLRRRFEGLVGVHSARRAYGENGRYTKEAYRGSMALRTSRDAHQTECHDVVRPHPESGTLGLFAGSYLCDIADVEATQAKELLEELREWLARPEFHYEHVWRKNMLVLWDNRSVLHRATAGYDGYDRLLHRLTIADARAFYDTA